MSKWISQEKIKWQETVVEGLENARKAFIDVIEGRTHRQNARQDDCIIAVHCAELEYIVVRRKCNL